MKHVALLVIALVYVSQDARGDDLDICRAPLAKNGLEVTYQHVKKATLHEEVRDILCSSEASTELWKRHRSLSLVLEGVPVGMSDTEEKFRAWQKTECQAYVARTTNASELDSIAQSMIDAGPALSAFVQCIDLVINGTPRAFSARIAPAAVPKDGTFTWTVTWRRPAPGIPYPVVEGMDVVGGECSFANDDGTQVPLVFVPGYKVRDAVAHTQTCRRRGAQAVSLTLRTSLGSVSSRLRSVDPPAPDLIIDQEVRYDGSVVIVTAGRLVFRPGGSLRFNPGANVIIRADRIESEEGAPIIIDGRGVKGTTGNQGARCDEAGCSEWWTDNGDDFRRANANCLPSEYGGRGGAGGPGSNGATIAIYTRDKDIAGSFVCKVDGGSGGDGGPGGPGRWHVHNTGGTPRYQCGNRGAGDVGAPGAQGRCELSLGALSDQP